MTGRNRIADPSRSPDVRQIGRLVVTPRSLPEYRDMFLLSERDLTAGPILDCPGGASPFGAQVRARGGTVVSVDPAYELPPAELMRGVWQDIAHTATWVDSQRDTIEWSYIGTADAMRRAFEVAADLFAADFALDNLRYVAASLPDLPFEDGRFRLTLCSHLIFCYPEYLSFDEHVACLLELVRVTSGEVRVYPLVDTAGIVYPRIDDVRVALDEHGVSSEVRQAACAYLRGGDQMFVCWRPSTRSGG